MFPKTAAKIAFQQFRTPRMRAKHKTSDKALEAAKIEEILVGSNILDSEVCGMLCVTGLFPFTADRGGAYVLTEGPVFGSSSTRQEERRFGYWHQNGLVQQELDVHFLRA